LGGVAGALWMASQSWPLSPLHRPCASPRALPNLRIRRRSSRSLLWLPGLQAHPPTVALLARAGASERGCLGGSACPYYGVITRRSQGRVKAGKFQTDPPPCTRLRRRGRPSVMLPTSGSSETKKPRLAPGKSPELGGVQWIGWEPHRGVVARRSGVVQRDHRRRWILVPCAVSGAAALSASLCKLQPVLSKPEPRRLVDRLTGPPRRRGSLAPASGTPRHRRATPLPAALARRQDARRLCRPGRQRSGARLPLLPATAVPMRFEPL
jgi:hypothetical protein